MTVKKILLSTLIAESGVCFGTSGVRGLVKSMTDEVCYAYVTAFLQEVVASTGFIHQVILGHDLRPSSPGIANICAAAIHHAGYQVIYAGALPTPALAHYAQLHKASAIIITGSHIPFDRNGIKFYGAQGEISKKEELVMQQAMVTLPRKILPQPLPQADKKVEAEYIRRYVNFFEASNLKGLRVAIYEHSSVARDLLRHILEALGVTVISLARSDAFIPIDTEAVRVEDVTQAAQWAMEHHFDAIFSTDGDADRPLIGDAHGQWLRGDVVGILCAKYLVADVVVTPVSSSSITEKSHWFNQVIRTRIGSPYVIEAMVKAGKTKADLVVGFEANGGFLLGNDVLRRGKKLTALATRDAVLPMLALLAMSRENGTSLSALVARLPSRNTFSHRLQNFPNERSRALLNLLMHDAELARMIMAPNAGSILATDNTDGFRLSFSNGDIVHLRASGNAPELRCYAETDTKENAALLCNHCLIRIEGLSD